MKRLLAALLTFSMIVSIVPFSAFADSPDTVVSPNVSAAAQNTSTPTLDADTIQAINSDPLLQGQYLSETSQPTVDTSDVTMEATDGFGKLLLNSIDEQNDASSNRIIGVSVSGNTATVEYVSTTDADIVVSIYTDDSAEEMVASGTAYAPAMVENTGSSTATVAISGTIPEYYTVKCYLLDTAEHAPLCKEYTDDSNTEDIVDLETATIDDFPKSRSVNFDENKNTNFAVTRNGVKLIRGSSTPTRNAVVEDDNENLIYQIENADDQFLSLKSGDIIVYPYAEGTVMIVKIKSINQSGNSVILHGDDSLDLDEVFDIVKLSGSANSEDFMVDEATGDSGVSYEGLASGLDETNDYNSTKEFSHIFKISSDDLKGDDGGDGGDDSGWSTSHSLDGTVSIKIKVKLSFNLKDGKESFSFSMPTTESIKISLTGAVKYKTLNLKELSVPISGVFSVGIAPKVVFSATGKAMIETTRSQTIGFKYSKLTGTQNLCTAPTTETDFKLEGTLYVGLDLCPKAKVALANKLELVSLELQAEAGFELTGSMKHGDLESGSEKIHACTTCYTGDLNFKITFGIGLKFLFFHPKVSIPVTNWEIGSIYAAPDFHDFGVGDCPHVKYRVILTLPEANAPNATATICRTDKDTENLSIQFNQKYTATVYLEAGHYTASATIEDTHYFADFTLEDHSMNITLKTNDDELASGTCGHHVTWKLKKDYTLLVYGSGAMTDFDVSSDGVQSPQIWTQATTIEIGDGVTTIGDYAFAGCRKLSKISLPDSITSIGTYAFNFCTSLKQIDLPANISTLKRGAFNGSGLTSISLPFGISKIEVALFNACTSLIEIEIPESVTSIGQSAFNGCGVKTVNYEGNSEQWSKIEIDLYNDRLRSASINYRGNIKSSGKCGENLSWQLTEANVLTISGNGEMYDYGYDFSRFQPEEWDTAQKLVVKAGVTKIGQYAFSNCPALTEIEIASTVKTIENDAFTGCSNLESVLLTNGLELIANSAFSGCVKLQSITLPQSVTNMGNRVFQRTGLTHADIMSQITVLPSGTFNGCVSLEKVRLPASMKTVESHAFSRCTNLADVYYDGNIMQWHTLSIDNGNDPLASATIHCSDGNILPTATPDSSSEENSIITAADTTASGSNSYAASFIGLTPGVNYAVIVSRSDSAPLAPQNLIYINQFCASSEDYQQTFRAKSGSGITDLDMVYVVAAGSYTFDDSPVNPNPGGSPSGGDTGSDGSSGGSGDGDGSGAGALLLVGAGAAAAAITAGVIMMSPVDVKGRVVLADQAAVPGAKISLLREGKVVAQTTADENGSFSLKAKRGSYQLTAAYTDANGQIIHQTIDIKAPAKDLVITF